MSWWKKPVPPPPAPPTLPHAAEAALRARNNLDKHVDETLATFASGIIVAVEQGRASLVFEGVVHQHILEIVIQRLRSHGYGVAAKPGELHITWEGAK